MKSVLEKKTADAFKGFTLIEVLIALLVLSIGLLGLAGLQATGSRLTHEAHVRSITTVAIGEIIDKIRMRTARASDTNRLNILSQYAADPADTCDPSASSVANDLACWQNSISEKLPEGQGLIEDNADGSCDVEVSWWDRESQQARSIEWTMVTGS